MKRRIMCILLLCALLTGWMSPAAAEDCFTIDVDVLDLDSLNSDDYVARALSASTQGVRVRKYISQSSERAAPVRLTLTQMDAGLVMFDKDYGFQSGTFDSGVIYLPYVDDRTIPYLVTLYIGDYVYAMPFMHLQPRLRGNSACTYGLRLRDLGAGSDWMMGTMVDLNDLGSGGSQRVDVCASGSNVIGYADIQYSGGAVCVDLAFYGSANVDVSQYALYVITDCAAFADGYTGPAYAPGEWIDAGGADSVMIYLPMTVSYDPAGLPEYSYSEDSRQRQLWERNTGSSGSAAPEMPAAAEEWSSGGWEDGWSAGGWDDGWTGSGSGWMDEPEW